MGSASGGTHLDPAIAMAANGDSVVAWQDDLEGNGYWQVPALGLVN